MEHTARNINIYIGMDPIDYNRMPSPSAPPATIINASQYTMLACIVCRNYGSTSTMAFPCGCAHPIHQSCVAIWNTRNDTCPTCRQIWINVMPTQVEIVHMPQQTFIRRQAQDDDLANRQRRYYICFSLVTLFFIICGIITVLLFITPNRK